MRKKSSGEKESTESIEICTHWLYLCTNILSFSVFFLELDDYESF